MAIILIYILKNPKNLKNHKNPKNLKNPKNVRIYGIRG